ncbi:MGMT family protein [Glaciibacter psychrotolerans]|uniref:O6-methylguanine-DNA--protein-cysteine methyltransferase n=1 Tax=Glaciibacter psychrotolerans TaxID=670054 RepID=A0A7Z0EFF7_9MICO|nr:O6-methylguanine-DNA--protein-cysteine methyltransferase [Leifsonia psychrotolerans]
MTSRIRPWHRAVGADGDLVGYASRLDRTRFLLALEEPSAAALGRLV